MLIELKDKWWKRKRGGGKCTGQEATASTHNDIGLAEVGCLLRLIYCITCIVCACVCVCVTNLYNVTGRRCIRRSRHGSVAGSDHRVARICNHFTEKREKG